MTAINPNELMIKKRQAILNKQILSIKKLLVAYKEERKTHWKTFKSKINADLSKIQSEIDLLSAYD